MTLARWKIVGRLLHPRRPTPKSSVDLVVFLLLGALSVSCLQAECFVTLGPDGSGRLECRYTSAESWAALLKHASWFSSAGDFGDWLSMATADDDVWRAHFKEMEPCGVGLRELRTERRDNAFTRRFTVTFRSLESLAAAGLLDGQRVSLTRNEQGFYAFSCELAPESAMLLEASDQLAGSPLGQARSDDAWRLVFSVASPGPIVKSNAHSTRDRVADPNLPLTETLRRIKVLLLFDGKGLKLPTYRTGQKENSTDMFARKSI